MNFDSITFVVWIFFLPVWLMWEVFVLQNGHRTISEIARQRGWQFTSGVFFWSSMPAHWWIPSPLPCTTAGTIAFWLIILGLFVFNLATWRRNAAPIVFWQSWRRWVNWPVWYVIAGPVAALLLFPQKQLTPWNP